MTQSNFVLLIKMDYIGFFNSNEYNDKDDPVQYKFFLIKAMIIEKTC